MSAISLKSITGITSITTPAGVDDQLTLHNNNTTEVVKLDIAGNLHFHNHLNITGVSTASNFKTGTSNLHNTGLNVQDLDVDGHTNLDNVSIAGVSTFAGDVSIAQNLVHTGDTDTKISFPSNDTIRFDVAGSQTNYIQFDNAKTVFMRPIMVGDYVSHSGIPEIGIKFFNSGYGNNNTNVGLGAEDNGTSGGTNHKTFQVFRQGSSVNRVDIDNFGNLRAKQGFTVAGISTFTGAIDANGDLDVDGHTNLDNVSIAGVVTATSFVGSGANLTSLPAQATIANNADNRVITGGSGVNLNGEANLSFNGTNVKIGSGTPAIAVGSGLEIDSGGAATVRLEDSGSTSSFEIQNTGGVIKQNMYNNQPWTVAYNSSEKLRIKSDGSVGIGEDSPDTLLHLKGNDTAYSGNVAVGAILTLQDTAGRVAQFIAPGSAGDAGVGTKTNHHFQIFAGNSPKVFVNVTDSSTSFYGDVNSVDTTAGGTTSRTLKVGASASSGTNSGTIIINNGGLGNASLQFDYESSAARAKIYTYRSTNDLIFDTSGVEKFRIFNSGDIAIPTVGAKIYTNNSGGNLTIQGGATYPGAAIKFNGGTNGGTGVMHFYSGNATSLEERMTLAANGRIGMSQSSPDSATLHIGNSVASTGSNVALQVGTISGQNRYLTINHLTNQQNFYQMKMRCNDNSLVPMLDIGNPYGSDTHGSKIKFSGYSDSEVGAIEAVNTSTNSTTSVDMVYRAGGTKEVLRLQSNGDGRFYNGLSILKVDNDTSNFSKSGFVLSMPTYTEYHYLWGDNGTGGSGQAAYKITMTCGSYFHCEFIYTQHQTNGGHHMHTYARGKWANNHTTHTGFMYEFSGGGSGLTHTFTVSDQNDNGTVDLKAGLTDAGASGASYRGKYGGGNENTSSGTGSATGKFVIDETRTYNTASTSTRGLILRVYFGSFSISKSTN